MTLNIAIICFIFLNMWVNIVVLALTSGPPNRDKNWYSGRITVPANLVFRRKIWGARDNGIPPRSTPALYILYTMYAIMIDGFNSINAARCRKWQIGEAHQQWNQFGRKQCLVFAHGEVNTSY